MEFYGLESVGPDFTVFLLLSSVFGLIDLAISVRMIDSEWLCHLRIGAGS
jgi:hypothetical protein